MLLVDSGYAHASRAAQANGNDRRGARPARPRRLQRLGEGLGEQISPVRAVTFVLGIAVATTFLRRGSASPAGNRLRGTDLSIWDWDGTVIARWYREGQPSILGRTRL